MTAKIFKASVFVLDALMIPFTRGIAADAVSSPDALPPLLHELQSFGSQNYMIAHTGQGHSFGAIEVSPTDAHGRHVQFVIADPAAGELQRIAAPDDTRFMDADATRIVAMDDKNIFVMDRASGKILRKVTLKNYFMAVYLLQDGLLVAHFDNEAPVVVTLDRYSNTGETPTWSAHLPRGPVPPLFWNGHVVNIAQDGTVTLYADDMHPLATVAAPYVESLSYANCKPAMPKIIGNRLIYELRCGNLVVVDLTKMVLERVISRFGDCDAYQFDVEGDRLYAVPAHSDQGSGAIFDLKTGAKIGVLPFFARAIAVANDKLAATVDTGLGFQRTYVKLFQIDTVLFTHDAQMKALAEAHAKAAAIVSAGGSADDAVDTMESVSTALLDDVAHLDAPGRIIATDYATWLVLGFDREDEGIHRLENLLAAWPDDATVRRKLSGAHLIRMILTAQKDDYNFAGDLLHDADFGPRMPNKADLRTGLLARLTVEPDTFPNQFYFWGDKMIVLRWNGASSIAVFDRNTLNLDYVIALPHDKIAAIGGITFAGDDALIWPAQFNTNTVGILDLATKQIRFVNTNATINIALTLSDGTFACIEVGWERKCGMFDPTNGAVVAANPKTTATTNPTGIYSDMDQSTDQIALASVLSSEPAYDGVFGNLPVVNGRWIVKHDGGRLTFAPASNPEAEWDFDGFAEARLLPASDTALVYVPRATVEFKEINLATKTIRTLLRATTLPPHGVKNWTYSDGMLYAGLGVDLLIYNLRKHMLAAVIRDAIPADFVGGTGNTRHINVLVADTSHLIAVTSQGQCCYVFDLQRLHAYAADNTNRVIDAEKYLLH